jgi:hypothetical protein
MVVADKKRAVIVMQAVERDTYSLEGFYTLTSYHERYRQKSTAGRRQNVLAQT